MTAWQQILVSLLSSVNGGPHYMQEHAQDAMSNVHYYGRPDLLKTFTSNPKRKEKITHELETVSIAEPLQNRQHAQHR